MVSGILIILPIFIASFYGCHIEELEDDKFKESWGDIYDGLVLKKDRGTRMVALFYPFWFVFRRLVFAIICIVAQEDIFL